MSSFLEDLSERSMTWAIEENACQFLLALGRVGGGEELETSEVQWTIGGSPIDYHNCVVRASLTPESADETICVSIDSMRSRQVPGTWHVGPSMRPVDLGQRLIAHGFTHSADEPGMAADLSRLREDIPAPVGLEIKRVRDERALQVWTRTLAEGFGEGEREASWVGEMYRRIGLSDHVPWRHYLGLVADKPVATASMFLGAGVAGIYFVFTAPDVRRRGIGAAISLAPLVDARAMGYRIGVLGSSSMGYSVYRRLGFTEYCSIRIYAWKR